MGKGIAAGRQGKPWMFRSPLLAGASAHVFPDLRLWLALLGLMAFNFGWVALDPRLSLSSHSVRVMAFVTGGIVVAVLYRQMRDAASDRALDILTKLLSVALFAGLLTQQVNLFSHLVTTLGMPLADHWLLMADRMLGFDWNAYAAQVLARPLLSNVLSFSYGPLVGPAFGVILATAVLTGRQDRVDEVAFLALLSGVICVSIAALVPSEGTWTSLASPSLKSVLTEDARSLWLDQFRALRGTGPVALDLRSMEGLATFPSYHACLAMIIAWASRGSWPGLLAGALAGLAILAATPVFGEHYGIDLIGAAVTMAGVILLWRRWSWHPRPDGGRP